MVAIVGARNASAAACRFARGLAHDLGQEGVVVVSGLARGIDSAAHDGSLESGTIAVIAGGIDIFYPPENEARQERYCERGLLIAEMPPGTEPRARHFPYRNRIIAGLAAGTVVVEAAPQSGLADHRPAGGGSGARGDGGSRLAARSARPGLQPADPRRRDAGPERGRRARGRPPARRPGRQPAEVRSSTEPRCRRSTPSRTSRALIEELLGPSPVPVDEIVRLSGAPSRRGADGPARARPCRSARPPCRRTRSASTAA